MKKFISLLIVLMLATPVFASNSNMVSDFGATSVAPALSDVAYGVADSITQVAGTVWSDPETYWINPSIVAYDPDFNDATSDSAPDYADLTRTYEIGKIDSGTFFVGAVEDALYRTALFTTGAYTGVLVTVNITDGSLVAMKKIQYNTGFGYKGILALGSGSYLIYGTGPYWGSPSADGFAIRVTVSGNTYVINDFTLFGILNFSQFYTYSAAYDSATGYAVFCGYLLGGSQNFGCTSLDVATLSIGDAASWNLPGNPVGTTKVNALLKPSANTQFFVSDKANAPGQVYTISFDLAAGGNFQANNWITRSDVPATYSGYARVEDAIFDTSNNLVLSLRVADASAFRGVVASLNPATGATVYAKVPPTGQISNGLCTVGSYIGVAMDASSTALAYVLSAAGTTLMASQTPGTAVADNTNAVSCAEVVTVGGNSFMALGGRYKTGSDNYETLMLVNGISGDFVERFYMTYPAGTYPTTTYKIFGTNDGKIQYFSNQGVGGQDFDLNDPSGPVPEFSLSTLLLAILLAGGLVVFVVRRRK